MEWAFHGVYPIVGTLSGGAVAKEKEKFFPFSGKNCTIGFHAKWKQFSTFSGLDGRFRSIFQGIPLDWTKLPSAFRLLMDV